MLWKNSSIFSLKHAHPGNLQDFSTQGRFPRMRTRRQKLKIFPCTDRAVYVRKQHR